jgi:hypothetical protein
MLSQREKPGQSTGLIIDKKKKLKGGKLQLNAAFP